MGVLQVWGKSSFVVKTLFMPILLFYETLSFTMSHPVSLSRDRAFLSGFFLNRCNSIFYYYAGVTGGSDGGIKVVIFIVHSKCREYTHIGQNENNYHRCNDFLVTNTLIY